MTKRIVTVGLIFAVLFLDALGSNVQAVDECKHLQSNIFLCYNLGKE